ncbi:MAG: DEAD/DEAH box helicase, partial [Prolixibacteraceae bacterium]|nr:DEAD/DEAH box helicase [Prolixibacteraceae bacterium]
MNAQRFADTIRIDEVKVVGQRKIEEIGLTITRPDSMAMVSMAASNLSELLSRHTPVFIKSYGRGSEATASFRGTAASHTKVEWNGMSVNSPMRGSVDLSLLPVLFVDDAFLLHGGSSLAESSGALGGSIHLNNQPNWNVNHAVNAAIERGSFDTGRYMAKLQTGAKQFRSITRFMYDHSQNSFPFYNVGVLPYRNDTLKNADYRKWAALQEFYLTAGAKSMIVARGWYQESRRNLPQLMSYEGSNRIEYQDDEQIRAQIEFKNFGAPVKFRYSGGLNHTKLRYFRNSTESGFVNDNAMSIGPTVGAISRHLTSIRSRPDYVRARDDLQRLLQRLPFALTPGQKSAIAEINTDMSGHFPMARLLQGDVGSGKTLVSFLAVLKAAEAGGQAALMAPTELLARQHAENAARYLEPLGIRIAFLTGNLKSAGRAQLLKALAAGEVDLVAGTHALFSRDVEYRKLRLVVVDEQHRFGVVQRQAIMAKGLSAGGKDADVPDLLMMSATPIPRSLALTVFGDLDVSVIRDLPPGR